MAIKACGLEPYDKNYGVGVSALGENFSPYERINKLLKNFHNTPYTVDSQRAVLVTEAYKEYAADAQIIKVAKALKYILEKVDIQINEGEILVGGNGAPMRSNPVFPEFSYAWVADEIKNFPLHEREYCPYAPQTEKQKADLLSIEDFWKNNTVDDHSCARLTKEEIMASQMGYGLFVNTIILRAGVGHTSPNYRKLLSKGYIGIRKEIEEELAKLDRKNPDHLAKIYYYQASLITIDAAEIYCKRYASLAREMAEKAEPERAKELIQIAETCEWISVNPPRNFREAIQLFLLGTCIIVTEANGQSISYGRFDQFMYPFYEKDIENGVATKEEIQELIEALFIKLSGMQKFRDKNAVRQASGRGLGGDCMTVGGVDRRGKDATNDLTFLVLEARNHTRLISPWMAVRLHKNTPYELKLVTANSIRMGTGEPKIFNDEVAIPAGLGKCYSIEDARDYTVVGCVEIDAAGYEYGCHDASYFNVSRVLELAITDGKWLEDNVQMGIHTGYLKDMKSFDEVLEAFDKQMEYMVGLMISSINTIEQVHKEFKPLPYLSLLIEDCVKNGRDVTAGGAKYNLTGPQALALGTAADSLSTIKQLIFDEKKITAEELIDALKKNWEGYEPLYRLVNSDKVHHYGNDDDYADELAKFVFDTYCKYVERRPNVRGGKFAPGVYSVAGNVPHGLIQWASADGRQAHEPVSDCIGAVHTHVASHDIKGPTAMLNSVAKLDHERAGNGTLLNWKFNPSSVQGETGLNNFIALLDMIIEKKLMHSQFNVITREQLLAAQQDPEKYKHLLIRVAGYSAYFVDLGKALQRDIIERTELSFD
ncbi:MAG: formate C-acetyltransferase/glycerol dehydratase family glycyl radical enzyme [Oscillospiraceae bacterium]|nr:formate C-acetyltransferase/glycerol dehydratase family glycyl radical enzyme [Oscillospiraceae bacterium]